MRRQLVLAEKSPLGRGGMDSKIEAVRMVTEAGESMAVGNGRMENVLVRLLESEEVGTLFVPPADRRKQSSRQRRIGSARPAGTVTVDAGAAAAPGNAQLQSSARRNCESAG